MTKKEFIDFLKDFPDDTEIATFESYGEKWMPLESPQIINEDIAKETDFPVGTIYFYID